MKASIISLVAVTTTAVLAQAPPMPTQFNFARCGMNTMVSGIAQSGCSVTDAQCLCKAKSFQKAGADGIPKKCPAAADQASFINFINAVCSGQQGYPLSVKERSAAARSFGLVGERGRSSLAVLNSGLWAVMGAAVGAVGVAAVAL